MNLALKKNSIQLFSFLVSILIVGSCKESTQNTSEQHQYTNALINETSPYLLQHAHNPVDWRPWSQAALDEAKEKDKLVVISIGYSSCHWCHVMEEETFENDSIAKLMNENFISIKVDREERPDIDQIYMTAVQLMQGNGGWPLNVITLPNGKPLYGGTYHTKEQWEQVLTEISKLYKEDPKKAKTYSDMVAEGVQEMNLITPSTDFELLDKKLLTESLKNWKPNWDTVWGGDKREEKFMLPVNLDFLLDYALLTNDSETLKQVELTLDKMAMGGLYDHVAGGFYRYSTDSQWKVPHFEKMLYDNAQAISLYAKAYKIFHKPSYKNIILGTISFLEREMKNPKGAYYAALDAQSEGKEGKFYVWTETELKKIIQEDFTLFSKYYTIQKENVWEEESYVLSKSLDDEVFSIENSIPLSELHTLKTKWHEKLLTARAKRIRPRTDDKILTSWNALLINGYVDAYTALGTPAYLDAATDILNTLRSQGYTNGELGHSYKKDSKHIPGFLEDYSLLANAALNLYSASLDIEFLKLAEVLTETAQEKFDDPASGMYTYNQGNKLIAKIIKTDDGVIPSPNAIMAQNLLLLGHIKYDKVAQKKAKTMLTSMIKLTSETPYSYAKWNSLLLQTTYPFYEVAIVGTDAKNLVTAMSKEYIPNILLVGSTVESELALFESRYSEDGTYIYVCRDNTCKLPVKTVHEAFGLLGGKANVDTIPSLGFDGLN
ncbi:thioredoxin domain-containing protein [Maribacter antarcticus]|uniref:thioredoxin domain-containing protein n=1 Tax=Maribacter antarcticus TaxID=505250 RepID=UPI0009FFAA37|nr:thioredoxin domain-containing protein [Maribacter antarcticus]